MIVYSGWLRGSKPTGVAEGDRFLCLSTKEVFEFKDGEWVLLEEETEPAPAPKKKSAEKPAPAKKKSTKK